MEPEREVTATKRLLTILFIDVLVVTHSDHTTKQSLTLQWRKLLLVPISAYDTIRLVTGEVSIGP